MESPRCEIQGCMVKVELRLMHRATKTSVEERHYCASHGTEILDEINREFVRDRDAAGASSHRCRVDTELVVCDGRDDYSCRVFLHEIGGPRRLALWTGRFEAWMLAWELKREPASTLSTHRAMATALQALGGHLATVTIADVSEGERYHAQLHIFQGDLPVVVDMRPSDAIVLAVVCDIPVYVEDLVWQKSVR